MLLSVALPINYTYIPYLWEKCISIKQRGRKEDLQTHYVSRRRRERQGCRWKGAPQPPPQDSFLNIDSGCAAPTTARKAPSTPFSASFPSLLA